MRKKVLTNRKPFTFISKLMLKLFFLCWNAAITEICTPLYVRCGSLFWNSNYISELIFIILKKKFHFINSLPYTSHQGWCFKSLNVNKVINIHLFSTPAPAFKAIRKQVIVVHCELFQYNIRRKIPNSILPFVKLTKLWKKRHATHEQGFTTRIFHDL